MSIETLAELLKKDRFFDYIEGLEIIESGDWIQDYKMQYKESIVQFQDNYYCIQETRSGSAFSDYHYEPMSIFPVERKEETVIKVSWPSIGISIDIDIED